MLNEDYKEMLQCLTDEGVKFLLVGAYDMAAHGYPRATMDINFWVMPSPDNAQAVLRALKKFGAPLHDLSSSDLQKDDTVFQIGVAPRRIDIITGASGLRFEEAFQTSVLPGIKAETAEETIWKSGNQEKGRTGGGSIVGMQDCLIAGLGNSHFHHRGPPRFTEGNG